MSEDKYYIIHNGDGDTSVVEVTKEELLSEWFNPDDPYVGHTNCLKSIENRDTNYWGGDMLIIKGSIVTPTVKQVVTELDIE